MKENGDQSAGKHRKHDLQLGWIPCRSHDHRRSQPNHTASHNRSAHNHGEQARQKSPPAPNRKQTANSSLEPCHRKAVEVGDIVAPGDQTRIGELSIESGNVEFPATGENEPGNFGEGSVSVAILNGAPNRLDAFDRHADIAVQLDISDDEHPRKQLPSPDAADQFWYVLPFHAFTPISLHNVSSAPVSPRSIKISYCM